MYCLATGLNFKGCGLDCSETTFGCCDDQVNPAFGWNREGCCIASDFGCCPDNLTPASGPSLEGKNL